MNPQAIAFQGEVQLLRWSETSNQGATITLQLSDASDLERFKTMTLAKGKQAGQRLAAVMVEVGDDEKPVIQPEQQKQRPGELCIMACTFCKDPLFIEFMDAHFSPCLTEHEAKEALYEVLGITSRLDLDANPKKAEAFHNLIRKPFLAWRDAQ
jgi:hypothetical protein